MPPVADLGRGRKQGPRRPARGRRGPSAHRAAPREQGPIPGPVRDDYRGHLPPGRGLQHHLRELRREEHLRLRAGRADDAQILGPFSRGGLRQAPRRIPQVLPRRRSRQTRPRPQKDHRAPRHDQEPGSRAHGDVLRELALLLGPHPNLHRPRHQPAEDHGEEAQAPGLPRQADGPGQPRPLQRGHAGLPQGAWLPGGAEGGPPLPRPRRLQERQRHARPLGGRRAPGGDGEAHPRVPARGRTRPTASAGTSSRPSFPR